MSKTPIFFNLVVAIILGLDIFNKDEAYYTVIGYVGFLAGVLIIMEISKFLYERTDETIEEGKTFIIITTFSKSKRQRKEKKNPISSKSPLSVKSPLLKNNFITYFI